MGASPSTRSRKTQELAPMGRFYDGFSTSPDDPVFP